jgi:hypothetical protein
MYGTTKQQVVQNSRGPNSDDYNWMETLMKNVPLIC